MRRPITWIVVMTALLAGAGLASAVAAAGSTSVLSNCPTGTTPTTSSTGTANPPPTTSTATQPSGPPPHPLNEVVVGNCLGGTKLAQSRLQVGAVHSNDARPENVAFAYTKGCTTGCQAITAAFQVVLIRQGARSQQPQNFAIAINQGCSMNCGAFAFAYQDAVDVAPGTRLSDRTRDEIEQIRQQADTDVQAADVSTLAGASALGDELWSLAWQLKQDVQNGLVAEDAHPTHDHSTLHQEERR